MADVPEGADARHRVTAAALNPEAGHHAVTADPRELAAAERAGNRSWADWPYYERRYGERGRRFTRSDSAWIATLVDLPPVAALEQVRWLGRLLAARGMPRLLLEEHLRILHEELAAAVPERAPAYAVLGHAAAELREERLAHMPDASLAALGDAFVREAGPDGLRAGVLVGAAVADERAGIPDAVESLLAWLADPARFGEAWVAAAHAIVGQARLTPGARRADP